MKLQVSELGKWKIIYKVMGIGYAICLLYIVFFARRRWRPIPKRIFYLIPFRDKIAYLQSCTIHTRPENMEFYKDLVGNMLLFVPFPFLLFHVFGIINYRRILGVSMITSFCIEIIQYIANIGVADIDDLILNTIGASLGLLALRMLYDIKTIKLRQSLIANY